MCYPTQKSITLPFVKSYKINVKYSKRTYRFILKNLHKIHCMAILSKEIQIETGGHTMIINEKDPEILKEIQNRFEKDRFATSIGAIIEKVNDGYALCSLTITEDMLNAVGSVMGGVYFTLSDFAFAVASNWNKPITVSLNSSISFLSAAKGKRLIAEARCIKEGKTTCYYIVDVCDDTGSLITSSTMNGFIKR